MNSKIIIGGIAGSVLSFFLGWVVYGMLLYPMYETGMNQCMAREMEEFKWLGMIGSNLAFGFFLAFLIDWTKTTDVVDGLIKGAIAGGLVMLSFDLGMYAMQEMFFNRTLPIVDVVVGTAFWGVITAVMVLIMNKVGPKAA